MPIIVICTAEKENCDHEGRPALGWKAPERVGRQPPRSTRTRTKAVAKPR
jgi:hypothetical protein